MAHVVDGLELAYVGRRSWKATVAAKGHKFGTASVVWSMNAVGRKQRVAFAKKYLAEMQQHMRSREPFVIALAEAVDHRKEPRRFRRFVAVMTVRATGRLLSANSIETEFVQRLSARTLISRARRQP